ncbi:MULTISPECIES: hypothetical protein [unclassified Crossiella]|uniref:hypothetical protein n=1 Tax=unclassified Crossiella TaxID=2620835 RepID=UPI001FFF04B5|nr:MULTISPECIES: hypothetical protein [unclassified Crossiella]MCK2239431.1 hypothetical protein [Crossiella sp. S99.2]MCK2252126.1 hypothetical protein [Crossiella sp. S99.1]
MTSTVVRRIASVCTAAIAATALLLVVGATESKAADSGWCKGPGPCTAPAPAGWCADTAGPTLATDICRR